MTDHIMSVPADPIVDQNIALRAARIRAVADKFTFAAVAAFLLSLVIAFLNLVSLVGYGGTWTGFIVAGCLLVFAVLLYLVAQLVHIRANTEH